MVPKEESSSDSDMEFHKSQQNQKKNLVKKGKTVLGRMLSHMYRSKPASVNEEGAPNHKETLLPNTQSLLPRIVKELPSPKLFTKPRMRKLSQNGNPSQHMVQCQGQERNWNRTAFVVTHRIAFLGSLSEMQKLRPYPGLLSRNLPFRKIPRWHVCVYTSSKALN